MNVLALTRYSKLGASSRLRFAQFIPYLEERGVEIEVSCLLDDDYLRAIYSSRQPSKMGLMQAYLGRAKRLLTSKRFDLIWVEKELFPILPAWAEQWLNMRGRALVVDYDDAIFHSYDLSRNFLVRHVLSSKIDKVMRAADAVVVGNEYLAERAQKSGARRVEIIPTVVELRSYGVVSHPPSVGFVVGWIGTPKTAKYLELVSDALRKISAKGRVVVRLVGAGPVSLAGVTVENLPWSEASEAKNVSSFDVGIMPLPDDPWERGKCGYKLIQYMACGRPVIASPVGANKQIVNHGVNGFLAETNGQWLDALQSLLDKPDMRARMGEAARRTVATHYSLKVAAPRLLELLRSVASSRQ